MKRLGGAVLVAAALGSAGASVASAAVGPACTARLVAGTAGSCNFDAPFDGTAITVAPVGSVTVTLRCNSQFGYTTMFSRTVSTPTSWQSYAPGGCQLSLTAASAGASGVATATPTLGPIVQPPPTP
jgi:hypothetical protein